MKESYKFSQFSTSRFIHLFVDSYFLRYRDESKALDARRAIKKRLQSVLTQLMAVLAYLLLHQANSGVRY